MDCESSQHSVKFAYVWRNARTSARFTSTFTRSRAARHTVTPTNGAVMVVLHDHIQRSVTGRKSGRVTTMVMRSTKCMSTPSKVYGPPRVIFCDRFAACTRKTYKTIWLFANSKSMSSASHQRSSLNYLPSTKPADEQRLSTPLVSQQRRGRESGFLFSPHAFHAAPRLQRCCSSLLSSRETHFQLMQLSMQQATTQNKPFLICPRPPKSPATMRG